jgi:hypothetical protein
MCVCKCAHVCCDHLPMLSPVFTCHAHAILDRFLRVQLVAYDASAPARDCVAGVTRRGQSEEAKREKRHTHTHTQPEREREREREKEREGDVSRWRMACSLLHRRACVQKSALAWTAARHTRLCAACKTWSTSGVVPPSWLCSNPHRKHTPFSMTSCCCLTVRLDRGVMVPSSSPAVPSSDRNCAVLALVDRCCPASLRYVRCIWSQTLLP